MTARRNRRTGPRGNGLMRCGRHGKECYPGELTAAAALADIQAAPPPAGRKKVPVRVYYEESCGFWHLTSVPAVACDIARARDGTWQVREFRNGVLTRTIAAGLNRKDAQQARNQAEQEPVRA